LLEKKENEFVGIEAVIVSQIPPKGGVMAVKVSSSALQLNSQMRLLLVETVAA